MGTDGEIRMITKTISKLNNIANKIIIENFGAW